MSSIPDLIKDFAELDEKRLEREKNLKILKEKISEIKQQITDALVEQGIDKLSAHGKMVYLTNVFNAKPIEGQSYMTVAQSIVGTDQQAILTVNSRTLTSFVRSEIEQYMADNELTMADDLDYDSMMPKELRGKLDIGTFTQLAMRKA